MDLIMNGKCREARGQGIRVEWEVQGRISFDFHMAEAEICALFGNIWNNALEACMGLSEKERWIRVHVKIQQEMLLLEV